jgi:hypothetical protein
MTALLEEKIAGTAPSVGIIYRGTIESGRTATLLRCLFTEKTERVWLWLEG